MPERADAIPEAAIEAVAQALCAWPSVKVDDREHNTATHMATDALLAAAPFLRAAQPEADRAPTSDAVRGDLHGTPVEWPERQPIDPSTGAGRRAATAGGHQSEADRAPLQRDFPDSLPNEADRAPGEVDAVARVLNDAPAAHPFDHDALLRVADAVIAALDALRSEQGQSRDDTVTLDRAANAMAAWLLEEVGERTHEALCELHPDV